MYLSAVIGPLIRDEFFCAQRSEGRTQKQARSAVVSTPVVTEIIAPPQPVVHDPFIDDLRVSRSTDASPAAAR